MVKNQNPPGNAAAIFWRCQDNAQFNIHINHTFIGAAKSPKPNQKFKTLIEKETKKNLGNFGDKAIKSISAHRGLQMGLLFFDLYHTLLNLARLITCFHYYTYILTVHIWENLVEEEAHTHGDLMMIVTKTEEICCFLSAYLIEFQLLIHLTIFPKLERHQASFWQNQSHPIFKNRYLQI